MSEIELLPWQNFDLDENPKILVAAARGSGKTTALAHVARRTDIGTIGCFAPFSNMVDELRRKAGSAPNAIFLPATYQHIAGRTVDTLLIDEPAMIEESDMRHMVSLMVFAKRVVCAGTPPVRALLARPRWFEVAWKRDGSLWHRVHVSATPDRYNPGFLKDEEKVLNKRAYAANYGALFPDLPLDPPEE